MLPYMKEIPTNRKLISAFGGYNHNLSIGEGEFFDMENLCGDDYPVLSTRRPRGLYASPARAQGMISKEDLCYVDGADFVIGDRHIDMELTRDDSPKQLISMGAYVIILPDKKYINTADTEDRGEIEASVATLDGVTFYLSRADGTVYDNAPAAETAPEAPENGDLWMDTSDKTHVLKQYSAATSEWVTVTATYIRLYAKGIGAPFRVGDGVVIEGITLSALSDLNGMMTLVDRGEDYIVVPGIIDHVYRQTGSITVSRRMPRLDFMIESENRLWGCRYGTDINGETVNEIYACKLGDFRNWNVFEGIATDSYAVTVGSDGPFTGAITHLGSPLFFKEHCVHKIYGSYPANFRVLTTACRGVQRGCDRSLAIVGETLYYKSRSAVCAFDGSLPKEISAALGDTAYCDAAAGALRNKYYITMEDEDGRSHFFVYDTARRLWHREDSTRAALFCAHGGELYFMDGANGAIRTVMGRGIRDAEESMPWMAQSGLIGAMDPDQKYLTRLDIRLTMTLGADIDIYVEYDSSGEWDHVYTKQAPSLHSVTIPIRPRRCDHLRLRLEGTGAAKIYSICKTMENGGVDYVQH